MRMTQLVPKMNYFVNGSNLSQNDKTAAESSRRLIVSEDIASTNFYAFAKIAAEAETGNFLSLKSTFDHLASL